MTNEQKATVRNTMFFWLAAVPPDARRSLRYNFLRKAVSFTLSRPPAPHTEKGE